MDDKNREKLFVEVDQPELREKIFSPLYNLEKYSYRFFYNRFAILGDFRIGKTELGKYIVHKMKKHYKPENIIYININSERALYKSIEEIDDWLYGQWLTRLRHINNKSFKKIVNEVLREFKEDRGYSVEEIKRDNYIEKVNLICEMYKRFKKENRYVKYIVEFDQANVIYENEKHFTPFYQFWRNYQGFWEDDKYFAKLNIFIFVIGHINWKDFASLKEPRGRGIFDILISYDYWDNSEIYKLFKKRLLYTIKSEYHDKLLKYFLCSGIIDFFGTKLGKINTVEYLDAFFGEDGYLQKFLKNFEYNKEIFPNNFLEFCKSYHRDESYDNTYFKDIEKRFITDTPTDFMPVFHFLSNNQDEPWFNDLFKLIKKVFEEKSILWDSRFFNQEVPNLDKDFISVNFSYDAKHNLRPEHNPPLFYDFENNLMFDRAFKECLEAIPVGKRGPIERLKRFITSKRIRHEIFLESKDGKNMKSILEENIKLSKKLHSIVQKWTVENYFGVVNENKVITSDDLLPFFHIRNVVFELQNYDYKGNSTNWAIFDGKTRDLGLYIIQKLFPENSPVLIYLELERFKHEFTSPQTSNIIFIRSLNSFLKEILRRTEIFDGVIEQKNERMKTPHKIEKYEEQLLIELLEKVKKYQGKILLKSDILNFLNQFPDRLRLSILKLLKGLIYFSYDDINENLKREIEKLPFKKSSKIFLGIFDDLVNKSNSFCSYLMKKAIKNRFSIYKTTELIQKLENLTQKKDIRIIFVDDVIGTGQQFIDSYKKYFEKDFVDKKLNNNNIKLYLIACVGSEESREIISKNSYLNEDTIRYVKTVRNENRAFSESNWKDAKELEDLKIFLKNLDPKCWDGWKENLKSKGLEYIVVMEYNTPNTTISCLWKETKEWKALFPRS